MTHIKSEDVHQIGKWWAPIHTMPTTIGHKGNYVLYPAELAEYEQERPARRLRPALDLVISVWCAIVSVGVLVQVFAPLPQGTQFYLVIFLAAVLPITLLCYRGWKVPAVVNPFRARAHDERRARARRYRQVAHEQREGPGDRGAHAVGGADLDDVVACRSERGAAAQERGAVVAIDEGDARRQGRAAEGECRPWKAGRRDRNGARVPRRRRPPGNGERRTDSGRHHP